MELAHAALRPLREGHETSRQARCCGELLGAMHLELWRHGCELLDAELLLAATQVLHDLTRCTLPEPVAQQLSVYLQGLCLALRLCHEELLREVCQLLAMWLGRYSEHLEAHVQGVVEATGQLLQRDTEDASAVAAMATLAAAACQEWRQGPFKDPKLLEALCEHVVLPNLKLRPKDLELFHHDLQAFKAFETIKSY